MPAWPVCPESPVAGSGVSESRGRTGSSRIPAPASGPASGRSTAPLTTGRAGAVQLPLVGDIAAGSPLLAEQNIEDYLTFPTSTGGDFILRVRGDSMIDAGIFDGDLVIVRQTAEARNGEIVVALAGDDESADEATVKTFYREDGRIRLQPENASLAPIYADYVHVLGRVVGVFREL